MLLKDREFTALLTVVFFLDIKNESSYITQ